MLRDAIPALAQKCAEYETALSAISASLRDTMAFLMTDSVPSQADRDRVDLLNRTRMLVEVTRDYVQTVVDMDVS